MEVVGTYKKDPAQQSQQRGPQISSTVGKPKNALDLTFKDLSYTVTIKNPDKKTKQDPPTVDRQILRNLNGIARHGEVLAIMGSSGAGKTSLLNLLSCRISASKTVKIDGTMVVNNQTYDSGSFAKFAGYVMQFDVLLQTLTPRESFQFVANLRIKATKKEKEDLVNRVLADLNIERAADTLIGGPLLKGISGGERKRTSIGVELITDPSVLFLDEPTSGLDSFTAFIIIKLLKQYAMMGKTIIFTIHQPSSDIFALFDRFMILAKGKFIFQGYAKDAVDYFASQGYKCPDFANPADYLMELAHSDGKDTHKFDNLWAAYDKNSNPGIMNEIAHAETAPIIYNVKVNSWNHECNEISKRAFKNFFRNPILFHGRVVQNVFLAFIVCSVFFRMTKNPADPTAVYDRNGALFFLCVLQFMTSMSGILLTFPSEREVFLREVNSEMYGVTSYFFGRAATELPFMTLFPFLFTCVIYYILGFNNNAGRFFIFALIQILQALAGNALGLMGGSLFSNQKVAMAIVPLLLFPLMIFSGFYINKAQMPVWIGWLQWLSPFRYAFEALIFNEYTHSDLGAVGAGQVAFLGFHLGIWRCCLILFCLGLFYRVMALVGLKSLIKKVQ